TTPHYHWASPMSRGRPSVPAEGCGRPGGGRIEHGEPARCCGVDAFSPPRVGARGPAEIALEQSGGVGVTTGEIPSLTGSAGLTHGAAGGPGRPFSAVPGTALNARPRVGRREPVKLLPCICPIPRSAPV